MNHPRANLAALRVAKVASEDNARTHGRVAVPPPEQVEFNESCIGECDVGGYLLLRCWDGVPPSPAELEAAAQHCAKTAKGG